MKLIGKELKNTQNSTLIDKKMNIPNYDYLQLHRDEYGFTVKGYLNDGYPKHSVCAGMTRIDYLDTFDTEEDALSAFPSLKGEDGEISYGHKLFDDELKDVSHIPDTPDLYM